MSNWMRMSLLCGLGLSLGLWPSAGAGAAEGDHANPPSAQKMEQVKWPGLVTIYHGHNWGDDQAYLTAVKRAGFTAAGCTEAQIEHCRKQGLLAFVFLWPHEAATVPAKHKEDQAVLCYFFSDRQPQKKWPQWAAMEQAAWKGDPHHPAIFTTAPRVFGGVDRFLPMVRARVLEYYHYHWDAARAPQNRFLYLEQYRQESIKNAHVPFIRLAETRPEDMRKTRQTIFTSLAYGARGFRYGGRLFDTDKRDKDGVPPPNAYGQAAGEINRVIAAFAPVFETARSVNVFHTAPLPPGTRQAPADHWVRPEGAEVVLGEFADAKGTRFLLAANRDAFARRQARLLLADNAAKAVMRMDTATGKWVKVSAVREGKTLAVDLPLDEAGCELLRVEAE